MKNTKKGSRQVKPTRSLKQLTAAVRETTIVYFGTEKNPEISASIAKQSLTGRKTETVARPSFDTGIGMCGTHLCNCRSICKKELDPGLTATGAFPGDKGATMGFAY